MEDSFFGIVLFLPTYPCTYYCKTTGLLIASFGQWKLNCLFYVRWGKVYLTRAGHILFCDCGTSLDAGLCPSVPCVFCEENNSKNC